MLDPGMGWSIKFASGERTTYKSERPSFLASLATSIAVNQGKRLTRDDFVQLIPSPHPRAVYPYYP